MSRLYESSRVKKVPTEYAGASFDQADSEARESFRSLDDEKKWTMGYWVEKQALKLGVIYGVALGVVLGAVVGFLLGFIVAGL
jgi:hypothetical protein